MKTKKNSSIIFIVSIFILLFSNPANAQSKTREMINVSVGLGLSSPYDNSNATGSGFYAQGEYVLNLSRWFALRPYAGIILTSPDKDPNLQNQQSQPASPYLQNQPESKVTSKALLLGGKARISIPIPYVAPYFEIGLGASIGSFQTYTPLTDIKKQGIVPHIPFNLGLALGRKHNVDVGLIYYFHPSAEQVCGAAAIGFSFPLD